MIKYSIFKYFLLALIVMLIIIDRNIFAQSDNIVIEHISIDKGLSHRNVNCVMEDSYGFLWIGTADGLNRYDGYEFVVYKSNTWDTTSLSSPIISILTEDEEGNIWVGTPNGLNLYQRDSDSFLRYTHDTKDEYSISKMDGIEAILVDRNNSNYVWIGTDGGGLHLFDKELQKFYSFKHDPENHKSLSGDKVQSLFQDSFGDFWIGTGSAGLDKINLSAIPITFNGKYDVGKFNSITFEHFLNEQGDNGEVQPAWVYNIYEDRARTLWVLLSGSHVLNYNREKNKLIPSPSFVVKNYGHFHEMLEDRKGMLWFGSHNKVYKLDRKINKIEEYILNKEGTRSSSNQGLCQDNAGNIWAATWDGIARLHRDPPLFEHYYHNVDDSSLPASNYMYSILAERSGKVWIGTHSGLIEMIKDINGSVKFINYSENHKINKGQVRSLIKDNKGSIWAAIGYTLVRIDPRTNSIIQYKNHPQNSNALSFQKKLSNGGSVSLLIDNADNLWISAWTGGISKASLDDLYSKDNLHEVKFSNYFNDLDDPANSVLDFIQDRSGFLWICTRSGGVIKFNPETAIFKNFKQDLNNPNSLSINYANSIHEDVKGNIWVGTYGGGLNKFDRESESFTHLGMKNGLPSDIIQGILEDDNGNLWISTNSGITKFNPENNKFRNYDMEENEIYFHDKFTGKMYFGNDRGFNVFHPDSIKESSYVPPVVITKFTRFSDENEGEQIIDRTISAKDKIELDYKDNIISFEFAELSFNTNIKCEYAYKLEGFNNNWISLGGKREVTFTNLNPGDYNFKVKACNQDGIWCENFTSLQIYISPPWWQTWWAYCLYVFCFFVTLIWLRRTELNRRKEKEDKRILKLENDRKTKELEEARALQLSMLPKGVPQISNLDIAAYMKTATEVGGDYYDFHVAADGTLTTIVADATGHGMQAGMMVTATKSLFQNLAGLPDLEDIFNQFNSCLNQMELQPLLMSVLLIRIKDDKIETINGGMPDLLIYKNKKNTIEEISSGGPPLGAYADFSYKKISAEIESGDVTLSMSDGFAERFNDNEEMFGYKRCKEIFKEVVNKPCSEIIECLNEKGQDWAGSREQDDDITFVILKHK